MRKIVNPFDFKLGGRLGGKQKSRKGTNNLKGIRCDKGRFINDNGHSGKDTEKNISIEEEAAKILDKAIEMGLEIPGGRDKGIKVISGRLELKAL